MENTTKMYIEHIVIGMQTTLLIFFILICLDKSTVRGLESISSVMEIVIVIPISYSLGIFIDRLCKYMRIFNEETEGTVKQKACKSVFGSCERENENIRSKECKGCRKDKISIEVWKKFDEMEYYADVIDIKKNFTSNKCKFLFYINYIIGIFCIQKNEFFKFRSTSFLNFNFNVDLCRMF